MVIGHWQRCATQKKIENERHKPRGKNMSKFTLINAIKNMFVFKNLPERVQSCIVVEFSIRQYFYYFL